MARPWMSLMSSAVFSGQTGNAWPDQWVSLSGRTAHCISPATHIRKDCFDCGWLMRRHPTCRNGSRPRFRWRIHSRMKCAATPIEASEKSNLQERIASAIPVLDSIAHELRCSPIVFVVRVFQPTHLIRRPVPENSHTRATSPDDCKTPLSAP